MEKISKILPSSSRMAQIDSLNRAKEQARANSLATVRLGPQRPISNSDVSSAPTETPSAQKIQSPFEISIQDKYTPSEELLSRQEEAQSTFPTYAGELQKKRLVDQIASKLSSAPVAERADAEKPASLDIRA